MLDISQTFQTTSVRVLHTFSYSLLTAPQVFTKERIDRETLCGSDKKCDLDLQVAVQSAVTQFFKKVKVTVRVADINDNSPRFPRPSIQLNVMENAAIATTFLLETATDLDSDVYGVKEYELTPSNGPFYVNASKGEDGRSVVSTRCIFVIHSGA